MNHRLHHRDALVSRPHTEISALGAEVIGVVSVDSNDKQYEFANREGVSFR